jgi:hypothetical protein
MIREQVLAVICNLYPHIHLTMTEPYIASVSIPVRDTSPLNIDDIYILQDHIKMNYAKKNNK